MINIMSTSFTAISSNLIRKALKPPPSIQLTAAPMFRTTTGRVPGANELHASLQPEIPNPTPLREPGVPPEFPRRADDGPEFDPIPLEQPVPGFPGPPIPSPPKPDSPGWPSPSPPEQPEVFPPRGPDVIPPDIPGEVVPPRPPMIDPPGGPDVIPPPPDPPEPGFPDPVTPDIPPPIVM